MKPFARFNTVEEHEKLVLGILKEKQIRQRIQELKEMKRRGLRTLAQIEEELENKRKREEKYRKKGQDINHPLHQNTKVSFYALLDTSCGQQEFRVLEKYKKKYIAFKGGRITVPKI